ncbi:MAG: hypothetical protein ACFUZC_16490 [Chthoniobacteraceae bacterium]
MSESYQKKGFVAPGISEAGHLNAGSGLEITAACNRFLRSRGIEAGAWNPADFGKKRQGLPPGRKTKSKQP